VSEVDLSLIALLGDFKDNSCAVPFVLVLDEIELGVQHMPDDLLGGN
jgi:hypothetical protein